MTRNKKIVIGALVAVALVALGTAIPQTNDTQEPTKSSMEKDETPTDSNDSIKRVDAVAKKIGATDKSYTYYEMINAEYGAKYSFEGDKVEIYEFTNETITEGLKYLYDVPNAEIRRTGNIILLFHNRPEDDASLDVVMRNV